MEYELKEKEGVIKVWEIRGVRENGGNTSQVSSSAIMTAKVASVVAAAMLDSTATLEEEEQNIHGPNREWSGISAGSDIVRTSNNSVDDHDLEEEDDLSVHEIRARAKNFFPGQISRRRNNPRRTVISNIDSHISKEENEHKAKNTLLSRIMTILIKSNNCSLITKQ